MKYKTNLVTGSGYLKVNEHTAMRMGIWVMNVNVNTIMFYKDNPIYRMWEFNIEGLKLNQLLL